MTQYKTIKTAELQPGMRIFDLHPVSEVTRASEFEVIGIQKSEDYDTDALHLKPISNYSMYMPNASGNMEFSADQTFGDDEWYIAE